MNIEGIKELRSKITPSPWYHGFSMKFDGIDLKERWIKGPAIMSNFTDDTPEGQRANADYEFIASSPEIVDYLLNIIEQQDLFIKKVSTGGSPHKTVADVSKEWFEEANSILELRKKGE